MIGGLTGLAAVVAGLACIVLVPLPLLVIAGVVMSASGTTLVVLALFWGYLGWSLWRWLTKPCVEPDHDTIHTPRGVRPEVADGPIASARSSQRKDEPVALRTGGRTSLDDPEDDEAGWDLP